MTKKWLLSFIMSSTVLLFAFSLTLSSCAEPNTTQPNTSNNPNEQKVHMDNKDFLTKTITINKGESLTLISDTGSPHFITNGMWTNGQSIPQKEEGAPEITNLQIPGNKSGSIGPFNTAGTFKLYCTIHENMNLTVVVV